MPSPFGGLTSIGVDETGYRKGHTCITVVVDHERHRAIWAHDGYGRDVFGLFFQTLTPEQRASIRVVAGDGARWIDSCVHEWCPNAERAPDGFHIVSWTSDAPDRRAAHVKRMRGVRYTVLKTDRQKASGNLRDTDPKGRPFLCYPGKRVFRARDGSSFFAV